MLDHVSTTRTRRMPGVVLVTLFGLAWACMAVAQSARPHAVAAPPGTQVDARLKISVAGGAEKSIHLVNPVGVPFAIKSDDARPSWDADMTMREVEGVQVELASTIRIDGKVVGQPVIVAESGKPASIEMGKPGKPDFRLEATLTLHDAAWQPAPTSAHATPAAYGHLTPPIYPAEAIRHNIEGLAVVAAQIDAKGEVTSAGLERLQPAAARGLGDAAISAVKRWRFEPARENGVPVAGHVLVPIRFSIGRHGSTAPGTSGPPPLPPGSLDLIDVVGTRVSQRRLL